MRILVVEQDPVFAALLEDRLTVSGSTVEVVADGLSAVRRATEETADLVILEAMLERSSGMEILRALRCQSETQTLPVLMLAEDNDSATRLAALKAGADDYLARPFDLEEVTLRADRLLGVRDRDTVALQGDLVNQPVWEVIQYIVSSHRSGYLVVRNGRLQIDRGRVVAARFKELSGQEALLAIGSIGEGRFRFVEAAGEDDESAGSASALPVSQTLIEAAWLTDELGRRSSHLPPTGAPLKVVGALPRPDDELALLPVAEVYRRVEQKGQTRLYDLLSTESFAAPLKVRLAVAWLVEQGALAPEEASPRTPYPTTTELSASVLLQVAVQELLEKARKVGHGSSVVPYFILASPGVWPQLTALLAAAPRFAGQALTPDKLRPGSSAIFEAERGRLSLHVHELSRPIPRQIETVTAVCAGVVLWVDDAGLLKEAERLIDQVRDRRGSQAGVIIATTPEALGVARLLAQSREIWRLTGDPPRSLLGLLRLLSTP